jgi:hypothetical protein
LTGEQWKALRGAFWKHAMRFHDAKSAEEQDHIADVAPHELFRALCYRKRPAQDVAASITGDLRAGVALAVRRYAAGGASHDQADGIIQSVRQAFAQELVAWCEGQIGASAYESDDGTLREVIDAIRRVAAKGPGNG